MNETIVEKFVGIDVSKSTLDVCIEPASPACGAWVSTQVIKQVNNRLHATEYFEFYHLIVRRYQRLVMAHGNIVTELAAGMKALPGTGSAFAHMQALWRFLANERMNAEGLSGSLLAMARAEVPEHCDRYALAAHDWSRLNYGGFNR